MKAAIATVILLAILMAACMGPQYLEPQPSPDRPTPLTTAHNVTPPQNQTGIDDVFAKDVDVQPPATPP